MQKKDINIYKIKKKIITKKNCEIKFRILKSLIQNMQISKVYSNYCSFLLCKNHNNINKFKHICIKNNKYSSVSNTFYMSKYIIKDYITKNKAQNCKVNSW
jgi:hypothetical protein